MSGDDSRFSGDIGFDDELICALTADHGFQMVVVSLSGEVRASGGLYRIIRIIGSQSFTVWASGSCTGGFVILSDLWLARDCVSIQRVSAASATNQFACRRTLDGDRTGCHAEHQCADHAFLQHHL